MRYSLVSREVIADSIETNAGGEYYDGIVGIPGCDKNMPGTIIGMARLDRPSIMVYGGTIEHGEYNGQSLNIVSAFEALGEKLTGNISDEGLSWCHFQCHSRSRCLWRYVYSQYNGCSD